MKYLNQVLGALLLFSSIHNAECEEATYRIDTIAMEIARVMPDAIVGVEISQGTKDRVAVNLEAIFTSVVDLNQLAGIISEQTDYKMAIYKNAVLIVPKKELSRDNTPLSERKVSGELEGKSISLREAVLTMKAGEPFNVLVQMLPGFDADKKISVGFNVNDERFADVLFKLSRTAGARGWKIIHPQFDSKVLSNFSGGGLLEFFTL